MSRYSEELIALAVKEKLLSSKEGAKALQREKESGLSIEAVLSTMGVDRGRALGLRGKALGVEVVLLSSLTVAPEIAGLIPRTMSLRYRLIAIGKKEGKLTLAMADPLDAFALESVRNATGYDVTPRLAYEEEIQQAIEKTYASLPPEPVRTEGAAVQKPVGRGGREVVEEEKLPLGGRRGIPKVLELPVDTIVLPVGEAASELEAIPQAEAIPEQEAAPEWIIPEPEGALPVAVETPQAPATLPAGPVPAALEPVTPPPLPVVQAEQPAPEQPLQGEALFRSLCQIGQTLTSTLNLDDLLVRVLEGIEQVCHCEASSILLYDEEQNLLYFKYATGKQGEALQQVILPVNEKSLAGWVALHHQPLRVNHAEDDPRHFRGTDRLLHFHTRSVLCVPILAGGAFYGVLEAVNKLTGDFHEQDQEALMILASQAGIAIANAKLLDELQDYFSNSVELLIASLETLEPILKGHIPEVARLSTGIARRLGITGKEYQDLTYAALLHDVGKLTLASSPSSQRERDHPAIGAEILSGIKLLQGIAPLVRMHHEQFSGNGFPEGLKGEEIPLLARILSTSEDYSEWKARQMSETGREVAVADLYQIFADGHGRAHDPAVLDALKDYLLAPSRGAVHAASSTP